MKYLCLSYFDPEKMDARPTAEIDAVMRECQPHMDELYKSGQVIVDAGLALETKCLQRMNGKLRIADGSIVEAKKMIGSVFLIEARDMEGAIRVASLHPTTQVSAGEQLGWGIEIRPIHYVEKRTEGLICRAQSLLRRMKIWGNALCPSTMQLRTGLLTPYVLTRIKRRKSC